MTGTVVPKKVPVTIDQYVCGKEKPAEDLVVGPQGGVKNVVVWLQTPPSGTTWPNAPVKVEMDQNGCVFVPHVVLVPAGGTVEFLNSDRLLHNLHSAGRENPTFNRTQPRGRVIPVTFSKPEFIQVNCDLHSWMRSWVVVADHPFYALSNDAGEFVKEARSVTNDGMLAITNVLTFAVDATRVTVRMDVTSTAKQDLTDVLIKRYCDIDVDTGGPNGWAAFQNHFSKDRDSIHAWNQPGEIVAPGRHAHIVNMVAMPSDVPLDQTFIGLMGVDQFKTRPNLAPIVDSARHDGVGILQWAVSRLRSGESVRLNMYYDAFCVCTNLPLEFRHDPFSVRTTDIASPEMAERAARAKQKA